MARATLAGVGMAILGTGAIYSGVKIPQPFLILHQQKHEISTLQQRDRALARKERSLLASLYYYRSHDGKAQLRHEQGALEPGERYVRLLPADEFGPNRAPAAADKPSAGARLRSGARRVGHWAKTELLHR